MAERTAVDQVTDAEQAVHCGVEPNRLQAPNKAPEVPVDITHRQVSTQGVGGYPPKPTHYKLPLRVLSWQA
ncbi:hypothetical protein PPUJ20066_05040 [Pseudomonas putida]|nr:hypothetical protein PPUJ20066_05040 [Pseudomonas putida]